MSAQDVTFQYTELMNPHSDTLNLLIRLILSKIQPNHLKTFRCVLDVLCLPFEWCSLQCIQHLNFDVKDLEVRRLVCSGSFTMKIANSISCNLVCMIDDHTLSFLNQRQGQSLQTVTVPRSSNHFGLESFKPCALQRFGLSSIEAEADSWVYRFIYDQFSYLRRLHLGVERDVVLNYSVHGQPTTANDNDRDIDSETITDEITRCFARLPEWSGSDLPIMHLEEFQLCGLNLHHFITAHFRPVINFNTLKFLTLESCLGLETALPDLSPNINADERVPPMVGCASLEVFKLRAEGTTDDLKRTLGAFLVSLKPLKKLYILMEGPSKADITELVLRRHGESLQSLVWDERHGPRHRSAENKHMARESQLQLISKHCKNLLSLGIAIQWSSTIDYDGLKQRKVGANRASYSYAYF